MKASRVPLTRVVALVGAAALLPLPTQAGGIFRHGAGARSMALGGTATAQPDQPLEAMHANPAGLGLATQPELQLGGFGGFAGGEHANVVDADGELDRDIGGLPEAALVFPLKSAPVTFGLAVIPEAAVSADWQFVDAPGGLGGTTSYGLQQHHSEILVLRSSLGVSVALGERLFLGASVGLIYNRNRLESPYIFQSHPALRGFKTLLDLETDGFGVNGSIGLVYRPTDTVHVGVSYLTPTKVESTGSAVGNAGLQLTNLGPPFSGARPDFRYDAEVENEFPQAVSAGVSWQVHPRFRVIVQVDWVDWSSAFDDLEITLANGDNADLNGLLGTDRLDDVVPLDWRDRFVFRAGLEFSVTEQWLLRAGYAYGWNPVPAATLTPMTAAIFEHTVTAGVEWRGERWSVALAYQYSLPNEVSVGTSGLAAGEYSNSRTKVDLHWLGLTTNWRF